MEKQLIENVAPNSVELSTNAKGKVQVSVKVYDADPAVAAKKSVEILEGVLKQLGDKAAS